MFLLQEKISSTTVLKKNKQIHSIGYEHKNTVETAHLSPFQRFISTKNDASHVVAFFMDVVTTIFCLPNPQLWHLGPDHAIGLPGARLSIGDHRTIVATTHGIHNRRHRGIVELGEWRWRWRKVWWDDVVFCWLDIWISIANDCAIIFKKVLGEFPLILGRWCN